MATTPPFTGIQGAGDQAPTSRTTLAGLNGNMYDYNGKTYDLGDYTGGSIKYGNPFSEATKSLNDPRGNQWQGQPAQSVAPVDYLHGSNGQPPPTPPGIIAGAVGPGTGGTPSTTPQPASGGIASNAQGTGGSTSSSSSSTSITPGANGNPAQLGTPTAWNVTAPQTVEGRIANIVDPNNPIIQQAQAQARIAAAGQGLQNTSMATTAGEAAAYQAAIPIAQADAATAAKAAGYNADQSNQFATHNVDAQNQFHLADKSIASQSALQTQSIQGQKELAGINRDTQLQIGKMNVDAQATANKLQADNQKLIQTNSGAASTFNQAMAAINNINANDKMDAEHKTQAIAEIWHTTQSSLKVIGSVAGLDLTSTLSLANTPGFNAQGQWVGFPSGSAENPAPATAPSPNTV